MTINSFKKKILAWDEFDKNFYVLENSINTKIEDLLFIEKQKQILLENTILFAQGIPSNNGLLWGARGTGKSSLIFSVFNYVKEKYNITLLEIKRNQVFDPFWGGTRGTNFFEGTFGCIFCCPKIFLLSHYIPLPKS